MTATQWKFYLYSKDAWEAMLVECQKAKRSIDLEQFILVPDEIGMRFIEVCRQKVKEGVQVRILCDAAGSFSFFGSTLAWDLIQEGVKIVFFNTFIPWTRYSHTPWFFRDHQKLLIVDEFIAFTGGICLSDEMEDWRDTHVAVQGPIVSEMIEVFNNMWERAHKFKFRRKKLPILYNEGFNYVTNAPLPRQRFIYYRFVEAIRNAKKYVYLTTPYFVPDHRFVRVLKLAIRRKVEVRILVPEHSDHPLVDIASATFFTNLLKSGIKLFRYKAGMLHAKTAVIDGEWASVGSFNLDHVSFLYNFEGNIISTERRFVEDIRSHFVVDLHNANEITLERWSERSLIQKIKEFLIRPFRQIF